MVPTISYPLECVPMRVIDIDGDSYDLATTLVRSRASVPVRGNILSYFFKGFRMLLIQIQQQQIREKI